MKDKLLYTLSISVFAASLLLGLVKSYVICDCLMLISVLLYMAGSIFYTKRDHALSTDSQMLTVTLIFTIFWIEQLIFCDSPIINYPVGIASLISFVLSSVFLIRKSGKRVIGALKTYMKLNGSKLITLAIMIALTACLYASHFDIWFRGDSDTYLRGFMSSWNTWDFTPNTFEAFTLAGHLSGAYAFILYLVSMPLRALGVSFGLCVRITGVVMMALMLTAFFFTLMKITPEFGAVKAFLVMLILVVSPSFLGTSYIMDSDFPQTVLLMLFFVSLVYDLKIFKYLFALGLCFTKETAIVLLFGIFIGDLIVSIRQDKTKGIIKKAISFVVGETHYIYATAIFLLPMAFSDTGWSKILKGAIKSILGIKSDTLNNTPNLADKTAYKLLKLEGIFASHFSWILTIAIVLGFVFFLIKKDKKMNKELAKFLPVLTGCFVMFTLFSVFYFTYPHYRYLKSGYLMLVLFLAVAVEIVDIKELIKSLSLTCMAILMAFESFHTIDPVTNAIYTKVDCGNGTAVTMTRYFFGGDYYGYGYTEEEREVSRLYLGDGFEHNLQVEAMQHLFEKAFAYIDPDSDTLIVLDPIGGELATTTMVLFGTRRYEDYVWTNGTLDHFADAEAVNIASGWTQEDIYEGQIDAILYRSDYARTCSLEQNSDRIYYIDMPFNDRFEDTYLNGKDILEQVTIEEGIWAINILRVK